MGVKREERKVGDRIEPTERFRWRLRFIHKLQCKDLNIS